MQKTAIQNPTRSRTGGVSITTTTEKVLSGALIATIIIASVVIFVVIRKIPSVGRIRAINCAVYADAACTIEVTEIDWGTLSPGDLAGLTVYIKSIGNENFTMTIHSEQWVPVYADTYLTLDWNYTGVLIEPNDVVPTLITLYVDPTIAGVDTFSFLIVITAEAVPTE